MQLCISQSITLIILHIFFSSLQSVEAIGNSYKVYDNYKIKDAHVVQKFAFIEIMECFIKCNNAIGNNQVIQQQNVNGVSICFCSTLQSKYTKVFPNRYLEVSVSNAYKDTVYIQITSNMFSIATPPLLFYALDDLSSGQTLGSLVNQSFYQMLFRNVTPTFDCKRNSMKRNYLRIIPSEKPWFEVLHNGTVPINKNGVNNYTYMFWFKRNNTNFNGPIFELYDMAMTTCPNNIWMLQTDFAIHKGDTYALIFVMSAPAYNYWTHIAVAVSGTDGKIFINGTLKTDYFLTGFQSFGDRLVLGLRLIPNFGNYLITYDGCLGHFAWFDRQLTAEEINQFLQLSDDDQF